MSAGVRMGVDLVVDTTQAERSARKATEQINQTINKVGAKGANFKMNDRSFTQPLGRITGAANEFNKSLEASNARVIAFGASVGIINGVSNAFKNLVAETVKFEKVLADVNVVLNASNDSLQKFGSSLFDVAKNTAQSFNTAATAALEFSRQGLSMTEVIKRTNDALTLTRLTSLKAEEAVSGLTAAVNAFGNAGLTTTDIIDKLAAVDVKFAVSSEDLIKALERTGAVAIDAGVEIDSLIGLVAALQQTTARGGAVIGNGLKTIFTRIQRPESLRQLENMDMVVRDLGGAVLSADKILLNIAKNFDKLTQAQQSNVVQFSAGIFQANVFRASLRDLAKEQSLQQKATEISAGAAGEAAVKNQQLNKTISALASQSLSAIQELAGVLGDLMIKPEIGGFLELLKNGIEGLTNMLGGGEEQGSSFAKGIVRGIGNIITGPAAIAFGAVFIKLFANVAKFARTSLQDVLGMVSKKEKLKQTEQSIVDSLSTNKRLQTALNNLTGDHVAQEILILKLLEQQTNAMRQQARLSRRVAPAVLRAGVSPDLKFRGSGTDAVDLDGDGRRDVGVARGVLPSSARKERKEASMGGYTPGAVDSMSIKGLGRVVFNKAETIKQFPGMQQEAIMPPEKSRAGSQYREEFKDAHGFDPYASGGFVPNFASLNGSELMLSQAKMQLHGMPRSAKTTQALRDKMVKGQMAGLPVDVTASISSLIGTGEGSHTKKIKEVLQFLSEQGVASITRPFKITKLPRMRGRATPQKTEEAVMRGLQKEGGRFMSSGGRDGDESFPVDLFGLGLTPREVKSGEWNLPNLIMKSLRLYNDDELLSFAQSRFGASKEMIQGARSQNLQKSERLLRKKGILKENASDEEVMKAVREHGLGQGFVPNYDNSKDWEKIIDILFKAKSGDFSGARGAAAYLKEKNPDNERLQASDAMITYHLIEGSRQKGKKKSSLYSGFTSKPETNRKIQKIKQDFGVNKKIAQDRSFLPGSINWERRGRVTKHATLNDIAKHRGGFSLQGKGSNRNPGMAFTDTAIGSANANRKIKGWGGMMALRKKMGNPSYSMGISRYVPHQGERPLTTEDFKKTGVDDGESFERFIKRSAGVLAGAETASKAPLDFLNKDGEAKFVPYSGGGKNFNWAEIVGKGLRSKIGNRKSNFATPESFRNSLAHTGSISPINLFQTASRGLIPNFAGSTTLYRGTSPKYQKAISDIPNAPQFLFEEMMAAKTKEQFIKAVEMLGRQHATGKYSGSYNDKIRGATLGEIRGREKLGSNEIQHGGYVYSRATKGMGATSPSGFVSKSTDKGVAQSFAKALVPGMEYNPKEMGQIDKSIVSNSRIFDQEKIGKFIDRFGLERVQQAFKKGMKSGNLKDIYLNLHKFKPKKVTDALDMFSNSASDHSYRSIGMSGSGLSRDEKEITQIWSKNSPYYGAYGMIPNFADNRNRQQKISDVLSDPSNAGIKFKGGVLKPRSIKSKNMFQKMWLESYFKTGLEGDYQMLMKMGYNPDELLSLRSFAKKGGKVNILGKGFVPNFANPLKEAIARESGAGIPKSQIKVEQSDQLRGPGNPMGLAVTNKRDEPMGVGQGIRRARSMGIDPRLHGAAGGYTPNFQNPTFGGFNTGGLGPASQMPMSSHQKKLQASSKVDANTKAIQDNTKAVNSNTTQEKNDGGQQTSLGGDEENDGMGLMQLFAFQSLLSGANGMLEEFGTNADAFTKNMIEVAQAASNVTASFVQASTLTNEIMQSAGIKQSEGIGLGNVGNLFSMGGGGKAGKSFGGIGKAFKGIGSAVSTVGKGLARFAPLVGQLFTGFTIANEGVKAFGKTLKELPLVGSLFEDWEKGDGIWDLFKSGAERAGEKMEKLADVSDKASAAMEANSAVQKTQEQITKLEVLGKGRTLEQDKELVESQLTLLKQTKDRQKSISELINSEHLDTATKRELSAASGSAAGDVEKFGKIVLKASLALSRGQARESIAQQFGIEVEGLEGKRKASGTNELNSMRDRSIMQMAETIDAEATPKEILAQVNRAAKSLAKAGGEVNLKGRQRVRGLDPTRGYEEVDVAVQGMPIGMATEGIVKAVIKLKKERNKTLAEAYEQTTKESEITKSRAALLDSFKKELFSRSQGDIVRSAYNKEIDIRQKTLLNLGAIDKETSINAEYQRKINEINEKEITDRLNANNEFSKSMTDQIFSETGILKGLQSDRFEEIKGGLNKSFPRISGELTGKDVNQDKLLLQNAAKEMTPQGRTEFFKELGRVMTEKRILEPVKQQKMDEQVAKLTRAQAGIRLRTVTGTQTTQQEKIDALIKGKTVGGAAELKKLLAESVVSSEEASITDAKGRAATLKVLNDFREKGLKNVIEDESLSKEALQLQKDQNITEATSSSLAAEQLRAQSEELLQTYAVQTILKNKVNQKISQAAIDAEQAFVESQILKDTEKLAEFAKNLNATELTTLQNSNKVNAEKLKQAIANGQITELAMEQLDTETTSQAKSALLLADKELLLSLNAGLVEESRRAIDLERQANGLRELRVATDRASISSGQLMNESSMRVRTQQTNGLSSTREAAADAVNLGTPQGILAFAQQLEKYNKQVGNATSGTDRLRVKMAELNVSIGELNGDLVSITIENLRTGIIDLFKNIGTGAKTASEAWEEFGLKLADELLTRIMQRNIDKMISDLTFAFTGENGMSEAANMINNTSALQMNTSAIQTQTSILQDQRGGFVMPGFNEGGFVKGPAGVDKVPAMLTAGEFVVPKDQVKKMREGGRLKGFIDGAAQLGVQYAVVNAMASGKTEKDDKPVFDHSRLDTLGLGSDLDLKRGDRRLSSRFTAQDDTVQEYGDYLIAKKQHESDKINEKYKKKLGLITSIARTAISYGASELISLAAEPINAVASKVTNWAGEKWESLKNWGGEKFGDYGSEYGQLKGQLEHAGIDTNNLNYPDFARSREAGDAFMYNGRAYESKNPALSELGQLQPFEDLGASRMNNRGPLAGRPLRSQQTSHIDYFNEHTQIAKTRLFNNAPFNQATADGGRRGTLRRASGGMIPTMLSAGEGFVPSPIAQRIGYSNLNHMNSTGELPTIQGQGGVDNIGPVGLSEGDFIIRKSSTDKLLNNNPNMMRFAMQNPDGFKRGTQGYYQGGLVGDSELTMSADSLSGRPSFSMSNTPEPGATRPGESGSGGTIGSSETTNNININVSVDSAGAETVSEGSQEGSYEEERNLSLKIKSAVLDVIREEKRIGGELS